MQERTDQRERAHRGQQPEVGEYGSGQDSEKGGMDELKSSLLVRYNNLNPIHGEVVEDTEGRENTPSRVIVPFWAGLNILH